MKGRAETTGSAAALVYGQCKQFFKKVQSEMILCIQAA